MKRLRETAFRVICLGFSALLLVLSMGTEAKIIACRERAEELRQQLQETEKESAILRVRWESSLSLSELERIAREELGMQRCTPAQKIYVEEEVLG